MTYILTYTYSDVAKMYAGNTVRRIEAESPQQAVDFLVEDEEQSWYSVSNIKVYSELEPPNGKWEATECRKQT